MLQFINALSRKQKSLVFLAVDLCLIPVALLLAFAMQSMPAPPPAILIRILSALPFLLVIAAGLSLWLGIPQIVLNDYENSAIRRTAVFAFGVAVAEAGLLWLHGIGLPTGTHVMFGILYFLLSAGSRILLFHVVSAIYSRGKPVRPVLIYGAGTTGTQLAKALKAHDSIEPIAFIDDNPSLQGIRVSGLQVFPPSQLNEIITKRSVSRVLLAMPSTSQPKQAQIVRRLQKLGLEVQALPSFAQLVGEEDLFDKLTPVEPNAFLGRNRRDIPLGDAFAAYVERSVMVTGAGGSIGSELCRQVLTCRPTRLVLFELSELALYTIEQEVAQILETAGFKVEVVPVLGSITDAQLVQQTLRDQEVQVVLHAAAYKHVPLVEANPLTGLANNVFGTQTLAQESIQAGIERFILVSSDKAVRPTNVMGASKRLAELVVQDLAMRSEDTILAMVRFGNVLGSSGSVIPLFHDQIARGGPVTVTDPNVMRFFMTIHEAVKLVLKAGAVAEGGEVFVLDMGKPVPILQLARQVIESAGHTVRDKDTPDGDIEIEIIGLRPGEKLCEELTLTENLVGTKYQKISCAREASLSEIEVASAMRSLQQGIEASDVSATRAVLAKWVEGFAEAQSGRKTS
ncbi:MAG: polysaccharide biosynthesis protein [Paracoccaceae bacterium]